ncbi:hypothetical protein C0J52_13861 [Blattella germanica]|nr:hypothetical protein C0J52_13861 [Blattella germanica]
MELSVRSGEKPWQPDAIYNGVTRAAVETKVDPTPCPPQTVQYSDCYLVPKKLRCRFETRTLDVLVLVSLYNGLIYSGSNTIRKEVILKLEQEERIFCADRKYLSKLQITSSSGYVLASSTEDMNPVYDTDRRVLCLRFLTKLKGFATRKEPTRHKNNIAHTQLLAKKLKGQKHEHRIKTQINIGKMPELCLSKFFSGFCLAEALEQEGYLVFYVTVFQVFISVLLQSVKCLLKMVVLETATPTSAAVGLVDPLDSYTNRSSMKLVPKRFINIHQWLGPICAKQLKETLAYIFHKEATVNLFRAMTKQNIFPSEQLGAPGK